MEAQTKEITLEELFIIGVDRMKLTLIVLLSTLAFSSTALGFEFMKILKVKGDKAIVKLPDSSFKEGESVRLDRGVRSSENKMNGRRMYTTNISFAYQNTTEEIKSDSTTSDSGASLLSLVGRFGFNKVQYEYGPSIEYSSQSDDSDDSEKTNLKIGGFFEYNFKPNQKGEMLVPYAGVSMFHRSYSSAVGSADSESTGIGYDFEGGIKYFPYNDHFNIRGGLRWGSSSLENSDTDSTQTTTKTALFAGIGVYF